MKNKAWFLLLTAALAALLLVACGTGGGTTQPDTPAKTGIKVCQVTDAGGIDDKSFNATAWAGAQRYAAENGGEAKYLESQQQTDYERNINAFIEDDCDLIVTVGFLLGDATDAASRQNPDQSFTIVDYAYDPTIPNVEGQIFATDQAGFLAGYVAAGTTKTGAVGTFGGIQIPPVTVFMDGLAYGVAYYNQQHGTNVRVLGWDAATQTGLFTGNFESTDDGRNLGESLMDEGADIIMPVAGPVGLGTAAAVRERGNAWIIGVDTDWTVSSSEYSSIILTSVLKRMDNAVYEVAKQVQDGTFQGGVYFANLANGGVGIADFGASASVVPDSVKDALPGLIQGIIAGDIKTAP
jgi:basic membrane protein A